MAKKYYDPEIVCKAIGRKIRTLREQRGWKLEDVEEHGWHSWQQFQKIESGGNITIRTLVRVANILEVDPMTLLKDL